MSNRYVIMLETIYPYRITKPGTIWKIDSGFNFDDERGYVFNSKGMSLSIDTKDAKIIELHELEEVIYGY